MRKPTCLNFETNYFRHVRDLNGNLVPIDVARWNGRLVPRFDRFVTEPPNHAGPAEESPAYREFEDVVFQNLNELERRTARLAMLYDQSITEMAGLEGVTRQAIIDRFHRMVDKNECVKLWWRRKKKINQYQ